MYIQYLQQKTQVCVRISISSLATQLPGSHLLSRQQLFLKTKHHKLKFLKFGLERAGLFPWGSFSALLGLVGVASITIHRSNQAGSPVRIELVQTNWRPPCQGS